MNEDELQALLEEQLAFRQQWETPETQFRQFVGAQTPQFAYQAPYTTRQNELLTRYRLADPYMWGPSTGAASTPTFRDYIGGGASPSGAPMWGQGVGIDELTRRAKAASDIGALSAPDLATRWREAELEDDPVAARNRLAWYYSEFGPENRAQSQLNLASMLAMQRPGGGQYGGRLGQAIQNLLSRVQLGRETEIGGAPEQFLDWYLGSPSSRTSVATSAPAVAAGPSGVVSAPVNVSYNPALTSYNPAFV